MKTTFTKLAAILIASAVTLPVFSGELVIKPSRYTPPANAVFATPAGKPLPVAPCCKERFTTTTTQDSKLKTKTISIATHGCAACKTSIKSVGAQKAGRKDVVEHTCAGKTTTVAVCCTEMPEMK